MGQDITATDNDRRIALRGIMLHIKATNIADKYDSLAHALHETGMWDYIFHQV